MAKVRRTGTDVELALRKELYRRDLRYRVDYGVLKKPRRVADVAFPWLKIAIFIDGCFWLECPEHATWSKQNAEFSRQKVEKYRLRDADTNLRLLEDGWTVLRFWAHDSPVEATQAVAKLVAMARAERCTSPGGSKKN